MSAAAMPPPSVVTSDSKMACIGLGNMGGELGGQIAKKYGCHVFDLDAPTTAAHATQHGSVAAATAADAVSDADVVIVCLPTSEHVGSILDTITQSGSLSAGAIVLDCTSGSMQMSQVFEQQLAEHGLYYVDCAVSGGPAGARNGILTAFIGGDNSAFAACEEAIGTFAKKQVYLGPAGSGHATKAVNNILLAAQNWAACEAMAVLKHQGVDLHQALEAINTSSGRSWSSMQRMPDNILSRKFDYGFSIGLHRKDCEGAVSLMQLEKGAMTTPILNQTRLLMNLAVAELGEDADHTEVAKLVEKWNNVVLE
jgi:3-hydroxyisobutyrate dehydrogenase